VSLRDIPLKRRYRSNEDDLLRSFYRPCLGEAVAYRRAAGFFSGAALGLAAQGLRAFVARGGRMTLVVSPELPRNDYLSAKAGYERRAQLVEETVTQALRGQLPDATLREQLGLLGWLIARERLDIKVAVVARGDETGIYHEKFGLFEDEEGNRVAFHGSANESRRGLVGNFESLMVFRSWLETDREDVEDFEREYDALWADETANLEMHDFPEAARKELIRLAPEDLSAPATETPPPSPQPFDSPRLPSGLELRDYQRAAMSAWFKAEGRGVLEMATGAGKTVTALAAYERLCAALAGRGESLMAIVVCPYQHLVDQWAEAARQFGVEPILCYRSRETWAGELSAAIRAVRQGAVPTRLAIATNATFQGAYFKSLLADCPEQSLIVADEVHNLGSPSAREALPAQFAYRLALSATPERHYDREGSEALFEYFGSVVFRFGLAEAIAAGALTPYEYAVSVVELDGEELDAYVELSGRIARAVAAAGLDGPAAQALLIARARILASASGKLPALAAAIKPYAGTSHNLVYCGDGTSQGDTGVSGVRQIEAVVQLLGREIGMRVKSYTAETPTEERRELRRRFETGDLQALVAIRCLDEGVDIPETERAFVLASSTNPRQYIQRRGRVLRRSPATGKKHAYIHDFLVVPPPGVLEERLWQTERNLVGREIERVVEFAGLATNGPVALDKLAELRQRYGLLHL
jgi:DNA phosphorothioation system restriction enzyme